MNELIRYNEKAFTVSKMSDYRRFSLAQKLRKDLLNHVIYRPELEKQKLSIKNQIEKILEKKFSNIEELFNNNFKSGFKDFVKDVKIFKPVKMRPTDEANNVIKLFSKIYNSNISLFIHGSHADSQITNFSDMDVSLFIKNSGFTNLKKTRTDILLLNNIIKITDLESHHSIFLNLDVDLECYPESFMPVKVLSMSAIPQNQTLNLKKIRFSDDITLDSFFRISETLRKIIDENRFNNFSTIKNIISSYFMLLILKDELLTSDYRDKKTIFDEITEKNGRDEFLDIFETCSLIRKNWPLQGTNVDYGISQFFLSRIKKHIDNLNLQVINSDSFHKILTLV